MAVAYFCLLLVRSFHATIRAGAGKTTRLIPAIGLVVPNVLWFVGSKPYSRSLSLRPGSVNDPHKSLMAHGLIYWHHKLPGLPVPICLAVLCISMLGFQLCAVHTQAPTNDEPSHLVAGLSIWQTGCFDVYIVNPPAVRMLATLPLNAMAPKTDWSHASPPRQTMRTEFFLGRDFIFLNGRNSIEFLRTARTMCLLFSVAGMFVCFKWASEIASPAAGLMAAALWAFSPMVLGHGSLITADVAAATTGAGSLYLFRVWVSSLTWKNAALFGLSAGMALITKFTWFFLLPCVLICVVPIWQVFVVRSPLLTIVMQLFLAFCIACFCVNWCYGFDRTGTPLGELKFVSKELTTAPGVSDPLQPSESLFRNRFWGSIAGRIPVPLPALYLEGIDLQKRDFESPRDCYCLGKWTRGGPWYYYLLGIAVKETTAVIVLFAMAGLFLAIRMGRCMLSRFHVHINLQQSAPTQNSGRSHVMLVEVLTLLIPSVGVIVLVSTQLNMCHHVRYTIPALPFLYILVAYLLHSLASPHLRRSAVGYLSAGLLIFHATESALCAPDWISFFNSIVRGPDHGNEVLLESNFDWGQDVLRLVKYQATLPPEKKFFAAVKSLYDPEWIGLRARPVPLFFFDRRQQGVFDLQPGVYAVSKCIFQGSSARIWAGPPRRYSSGIDYLLRLKPTAQVGRTILIYDVTADDAAELRHELQSEAAGAQWKIP